MKKYKIVDKKRFYAFLTISFIFIISGITLFSPSEEVYSKVLKEKFIEIQISKGDTLWNISAKYMPKDYDIRKMIYEIKDINELETSYIFPGDIIRIPIVE